MDKMKIIINKNAIKTRTFTTSEIGRGVGVHSIKKGKGSYSRKAKYKKQYKSNDDCIAFFYSFLNSGKLSNLDAFNSR